MRIELLEKKYKSFIDFIRFTPAHCDIDPFFSDCDIHLEVDLISDCKSVLRGGYFVDTFIVMAHCKYHNTLNYKYRSFVNTGRKK